MDSVARRALVVYMSDLSERYSAAAWLEGWELVCRPDDGRFADHEVFTLRLLNDAVGGWWPESFEDAEPFLSE